MKDYYDANEVANESAGARYGMEKPPEDIRMQAASEAIKGIQIDLDCSYREALEVMNDYMERNW